jgi:hypothetical protein
MKRIKREHKEKIMEMIRKAGSEEYVTSWNKAGTFSASKKKSNVEKGRKSRARGARFELKVRKELEDRGWIIDKWTNNVDLEQGKLVKAKRTYNPFMKVMVIGTGFPDFIAFKRINKKYDIIGIEVKTKGYLDKDEKEKSKWYLKNKVFSKIIIAKAIRNGRKINVEHIDFEEKYGLQ